MRIGSFDVIYTSRKKLDRDLREFAYNYIRTEPDIRAVIAKMARSEVKNYLAGLAEEAELPFHDEARFLRSVKLILMSETSPRDEDADRPFADGASAPAESDDRPSGIVRGDN